MKNTCPRKNVLSKNTWVRPAPSKTLTRSEIGHEFGHDSFDIFGGYSVVSLAVGFSFRSRARCNDEKSAELRRRRESCFMDAQLGLIARVLPRVLQEHQEQIWVELKSRRVDSSLHCARGPFESNYAQGLAINNKEG